MIVKKIILFQLICLAYDCSCLEQSRLNANAALLLSESGRNPISLSTGSIKKPEFPPLGPTSPTSRPITSQNSGKVHDLVHFYNSQGNAASKPLSYSSIVSGTKLQSITTKPTPASASSKAVTPMPGTHITTPLKSPSNPGFNTHPNTMTNPKQKTNPTLMQSTSKPTTKPSFSSIVSGGQSKPISSSDKLTSSPVLPSSILGNRQGTVQVHSHGPTDIELQTLSEELLRKDTNNAARLITINYQGKTTSQSKDDRAPQPLVTVPDSVYNIETIKKFVPLLDNYERDTLVNEYVTPQERNEENDFMDAIMSTHVIRQLMTFLKDKGYVTPDPRQQRDFLKQLWFGLYSRGRGKISSSGFEHIFVSELKNGEVSGLHNWLYFSKEESANRANYLGYLKYEVIGDKGASIKLHFNQQGIDKPVNTMFIGTSPELEIALYSLCFITRADQSCPLKLGGKSVNIVTHTFRYRSKNMIGSAYPQI